MLVIPGVPCWSFLVFCVGPLVFCVGPSWCPVLVLPGVRLGEGCYVGAFWCLVFVLSGLLAPKA